MTIKEAIEHLELLKLFDCPLLLEAKRMAIAALQEKENRRWIPVTERLPESDGFYIVVMNGDIWGEPDVWSSTACGFYNGKWDEDGATISHWMPMPEPPKEDNDGK